jgi:Patatin-like phospholipase
MSEQPECDIVMKGGITSGVVYPLAAVELSKTYRFRSIGGTSAGAIAAAVVAAAEHGRRTGGPGGGFGVVEGLPGELTSTAGGRSFMLQLFQPDPRTRPLFDVALAGLGDDKLHAVPRAIRTAFPPSRNMAALGRTAGGFAGLWHRVKPGARHTDAVADLVTAAGSVKALLAAAMALPGNDFGLCRLGPDAGSEDRPALTEWLHARIQDAAGRRDGPVLTFADLWGAEPLPDPADVEAVAARRKALRKLSVETNEREVDLQMMTTDLTHGRPWRLPAPFQPYEDRLEEGGTLLYDPGELAHFFPDDVMRHLERASECDPFRRPETSAGLRRLGMDHLRRFPIGPDLPVIVGTRMSLSFPVLISAVPLHELVFASDPDEPSKRRVSAVRRVYFSDGGISSNFPVHFFDSPLPGRPTFGLQLTSYAPGERPTTDVTASVVAPPKPSSRVPADARPIDDMKGFFVAIKDAMQNWRDNAQSELPGFRDRIVRIKLAPDEGGLNLNMTPPQIDGLTRRGEYAGQVLVGLFAEDEPNETYARQWDDHRFTRFRTTMSMLERLLGQYADNYDRPVPHARDYDARIPAGRRDKPYAFGTQDRTDAARDRADAYRNLSTAPGAPDSLDDADVPRPPSVLRAVPPT